MRLGQLPHIQLGLYLNLDPQLVSRALDLSLTLLVVHIRVYEVLAMNLYPHLQEPNESMLGEIALLRIGAGTRSIAYPSDPLLFVTDLKKQGKTEPPTHPTEEPRHRFLVEPANLTLITRRDYNDVRYRYLYYPRHA